MSEQAARQSLQALFDRYQTRQVVRRGILGDSNGNVEVSGRPGWAYIRYRDDLNRLSIVRYLLPEQLPDETPVKVGRRYPSDSFEQVLGADWDMYAYAPTASVVAQYATDVITLGDLAPGKVVQTDPTSLAVDVRGFLYANADGAVEFAGGTIDLADDVPGAAGHWYSLIYMDLESESLASTTGDLVAVGVNATVPDVPENALPLGVVDLANGDTEIVSDDIYQYKLLYGHVGGAGNILEKIVTFDGEVMVDNGEVVWLT